MSQGREQSKLTIFYAYACEDDEFRSELEKHLTALKLEGVVACWHERRLTGDDDWQGQVNHDLENAELVLLLVSEHFLASEYGYSAEIRRAMERHANGEARVIPIILHEVDWSLKVFSSLDALPRGGRPISNWTHRDSAFADISRGIRDVAMSLRHKQDASATERSDVFGEDVTITRLDGSHLSDADDHPSKVGRYVIQGLIDKGHFGTVYLARDNELGRSVAIKIPHPSQVLEPENIELYLNEARIVAGLDHPAIVPVYDIGHTSDGLCFLVSKLIEGRNLAKVIKEKDYRREEATTWVATIAKALHHAHQRDLVHRDVKPANILIDQERAPHLTDFGVAIRDEDYGVGRKYAGTPAYMSPEQARRESHRVDGRSDIFSLGSVLYELLTKRRPFRSRNTMDLLREIATSEVKPPRQIDSTISKELERVCLKALANRITDRYTTAQDFAEELRSADPARKSTSRGWVSEAVTNLPNAPTAVAEGSQSGSHENHAAGSTGSGSGAPSTVKASVTAHDSGLHEQQPTKIVPKGLLSYDEADGDFFLRLIPGPRDHRGLPESIRFWKHRIEQPVSDHTFSVGLLYGASGCGKTSFVKAGLLPQLSSSVVQVVVEATREDTESRLRDELRTACPGIPDGATLVDAVASIRRGDALPADRKLLIVIDQFEQWLHGRNLLHDAELIDAIRQCDGGRVQCLLSVRDDYLMGIHRFMQRLEITVQEGRNSAAIDFFDPLHAKNVLAEFGCALGCLPEDSSAYTPEQEAFLESAISQLGPHGKIIPTQLSLLVEMMKGKQWTKNELNDVGGIKALESNFWEETLGEQAPLDSRVHRSAARAVLKALLPGQGVNIKVRRSYDELLRASNYQDQPKSFDRLIQILDIRLRLITPTGPVHPDTDENTAESLTRYYQLSHDSLVPSLRDWLTKQRTLDPKERAALLLEDRASLWDEKPENARLPGVLELLQILRYVPRRTWNQQQRRVMHAANRFHFKRGCALAVCIAVVGLAGAVLHGKGLVMRAKTAAIPELPSTIADIQKFSWVTARALRDEYDRSQDKSHKLNLALARVYIDPDEAQVVETLFQGLRSTYADDLPIIRDALLTNKPQIDATLWRKELDTLWTDFGTEKPDTTPRIVSALAMLESDETRWSDETAQKAVEQLVSIRPQLVEDWANHLRPVSARLIDKLEKVYLDSTRTSRDRELAAQVLASYVSDDPEKLVTLLAHAKPQQFDYIFEALRQHNNSNIVGLLTNWISKSPDADADDNTKEALASCQTMAAVALMRLREEGSVWPLLNQRPDGRRRSQLIHALSQMKVDANLLSERLRVEEDDSARYALILAIGEYEPGKVDHTYVKQDLLSWFESDEDSGVHGACEWLLRKWGYQQELEKRISRLMESEDDLQLRGTINDTRSWYINGQGQTLVILDPEHFMMGSPPTELGREEPDRENQLKIQIPRSFAIATTEVTLDQFRSKEFLRFYAKHFEESFQANLDIGPKGTCPVTMVSWYEAAAYCNWLSMKEGIPPDQWCYPKDGPFVDGLTLPADYLRRAGYRLPTEAEWEYACRSGATTSRFFGERGTLLTYYAHYDVPLRDVTTLPVASLKPNHWGFFDVYGNALELTQTRSKKPYRPGGLLGLIWKDRDAMPRLDVEDPQLIVGHEKDYRTCRGGSIEFLAKFLRSADRGQRLPPHVKNKKVGFRVARTWPPKPQSKRDSDD